MKYNKRFYRKLLGFALCVGLSVVGWGEEFIDNSGGDNHNHPNSPIIQNGGSEGVGSQQLGSNVSSYSFTDDEWNAPTGYEYYEELDSLGRVQYAFANVGYETMPNTKRGSIGMIKPTGWRTIRYDHLISDKYLYNRCHLIGYQLTGENANKKNLMTGTRYLNVTGMLPFENQIADYMKETGNHVLLKVTPDFRNDELVARGLIMEAYSIEDDGCRFRVYCYNTQPGINIDYKTGESWVA